MPGTIEFFYDFASPYTYFAHVQMPDVVARTSAEVRYRPFLLGGVFKAAGNSMPAGIPAKGRYLFQDVQRWAERLGVPCVMPPFFPVNSLRAMRGAFVAEREGKESEYRDVLFKAVWAESIDPSDPETLAGLAESAGLDREGFLAGIEDPAIKEQLKASTQEAVERGAFGAPTFFVNGDDLYWGNDRLDMVVDALAKGA